MKIAYFDCFSGVSGDMLLGAFLDAGMPPEPVVELPQRLDLSGVKISVERETVNGIAATRVQVTCPQEKNHRHLPQIEAIIGRSGLPPLVQELSRTIFRRLAGAEAAVHGVPVEKVHFHEVGAADAIVDIVGAALAWHELKLEAAYCSPISVGGGTVECSHGIYPVPAPATALLLEGFPIRRGPVESELATPTGAAVLTTLCGNFREPPVYRPARNGYGAGGKRFERLPNVLRLQIGESAAELGRDTVILLECNIDDMNPEGFPHLSEQLLAAGALDVFFTQGIMKKGRPGVQISVMAAEDTAPRCRELLFQETTTLGVRLRRVERVKLIREIEEVETRFGRIACKRVRRPDGSVRRLPEYEVCRRLAGERGIPLQEVYRFVEAELTALDERENR